MSNLEMPRPTITKGQASDGTAPRPSLREVVLSALSAMVLIGFTWIFGAEMVCLARGLCEETATELSASTSDPKTYVATALAALVGGVSAVFLGVKLPERLARGLPHHLIRAAYVGVYALLGCAAIVIWTTLEGGTPLILRNLAVTFLGLLTPAVTTYLNNPAQS